METVMNSKYKVVLKNKIEQWEYRAITYLYVPIIGTKAFTLYNLLICESYLQKDLKKAAYTLDRLVNLSGCKFSVIMKQLSKLNSIGLIEIYESKTNGDIAINIYSPADPESFFQNDILNNILLNKIGQNDYDLIRYAFRDDSVISEDSDFQKIRASFANEFEDLISNAKTTNNTLKAKVKKTDVLSDGLDIQELQNGLNKHNIKIDLDNLELLSAIRSVYAIYKFDSNTFTDIMCDVVEKHGLDFDKAQLSSYFSAAYFNQPEFDTTETLDVEITKEEQKARKIYEMKTTSPFDFVAKMLNIKTITAEHNEIILTLRNDYKLIDGVINALLEYSHFKNNKIVKNYVLKIGKSFYEQDLNDVEKVMQHLKAAHNNSKPKKSYTTKLEPARKENIWEQMLDQNYSNIDATKETVDWNELLESMV